jgi:hypothetical protein
MRTVISLTLAALTGCASLGGPSGARQAAQCERSISDRPSRQDHFFAADRPATSSGATDRDRGRRTHGMGAARN